EAPGRLWVLPGETAEPSCRVLDYSQRVNWYKEKPDGSLCWIYQSSDYSPPVGKSSGRRETRWNFSLAIGHRRIPGFITAAPPASTPMFGDGTRLVVTDATTEPQLSILVPVDAEEPGQPPAVIPLLCRLHDLPRGWDTVRWQPTGEETPVTAAVVEERGVLSAWSITRVSAERW
ncbi:hypothetical protein FQA23_0007224, partial [Aptenodytes patagonicus]